mmetsp:Transcript_64212/g.133983  ORF Transcript_64212/g.133983 Transcript_64212/m.133983 type:complete len:543 (+) Transcript_64212:1324-2952(+)
MLALMREPERPAPISIMTHLLMVCPFEHRYFSTVDGYGQSAKRQLLLAQTIHPCLRAGAQGQSRGSDPESSASECKSIAVPDSANDMPSACESLESEEREEDGPGEENRLCNWLGQGPLACLKDLFLMEHGPRLRAKLAHGDIEIFAGHCLSDRDKMRLASTREAQPEGEMTQALPCGMEDAKELGALLLALLVKLCHRRCSDNEAEASAEPMGSGVWIGGAHSEVGAARGVAEGASDGDSVVVMCCWYMEAYEPVFHPLMLLRRELEQLKASVESWTQIASRFSPGVPQPSQGTPSPCDGFPADQGATPREVFQIVVKVSNSDDLVISDSRGRLEAAAQVQSDAAVEQLLLAALRASSALPTPTAASPSRSSIAALGALLRGGVHSVAGIECLRACAGAGAQIARAVAHRLLHTDGAIRSRTARTPERRQLLQALAQAQLLTSALLALTAVIDLQILHCYARSGLCRRDSRVADSSGAEAPASAGSLAPAFRKILCGVQNTLALVEKNQYHAAVCKLTAALTEPELVGAVDSMCEAPVASA